MNPAPSNLAQKLRDTLPERQNKKAGRNKIPTEILIEGILMRICFGMQWRYIPHHQTVRRYCEELYRRGTLFQLLNEVTPIEKRPQTSIIDATNINCWNANSLAQYSGKYHNYCVKLTVSVDENGKLQDFSIDPGAKHDSKILDDMLSESEYLPYDMYLDKGYESYERRRWLQSRNCQVHMEQKNYSKNRKRGPHFQFTDADRSIRSRVERFFSIFKQFNFFRFASVRKRSSLKMAVCIALLLIPLILLHPPFPTGDPF